MDAEENERLGREALSLFTQILWDYAATVGDNDPIDTRIAVEEYLSAQPIENPSEAIKTLLRALAEAVRDTVLSELGGR